MPTSSFETHHTVGECRLCDAPQDEVAQAVARGAAACFLEFKLTEHKLTSGLNAGQVTQQSRFAAVYLGDVRRLCPRKCPRRDRPVRVALGTDSLSARLYCRLRRRLAELPSKLNLS